MTYEGPRDSDYANVRALNHEYLRLISRTGSPAGLRDDLRHRFASLRRTERERLAAAPFLLFSLQQADTGKWQSLLAEQVNEDLFTGLSARSAELAYLVTMTAGFLWQLARSNPYAVRLLCGSPAAWCSLLAGISYVELVSRLRRQADLPVLRATQHDCLWERLLTHGVSADSDVRRAAHIAALQFLLTQAGERQQHALAARESRVPRARRLR